MVLTETDAQTVRPYRSRLGASLHQPTGFTTRRPDDFPIPLELFWDFFRGYFLFPREERKNSSDLSFDSSEVSFDSSEEIFLAHVENQKYPRGESKISTEASRRPSCVTDLLAVERLCVEAVFDQNSIG